MVAVEELDVLELGPGTLALPMVEPMAMAPMALCLALCPELLLLTQDLLDLEILTRRGGCRRPSPRRLTSAAMACLEHNPTDMLAAESVTTHPMLLSYHQSLSAIDRLVEEGEALSPVLPLVLALAHQLLV